MAAKRENPKPTLPAKNRMRRFPMTFAIDKELYLKFDRESKKQYITTAELVRRALSEYAKNNFQ